MKLFQNKKTRLLAVLSTNIAVLSAALVISTVSWFSRSVRIDPESNVPSSILTAYFDTKDGADTTAEFGSIDNPFVITRPVHYYNLVRLHELGIYGFDRDTYIEFGKTNIEGTGNVNPLFYSYNDNGVIQTGSYTTHLNMSYYSGSLALSPIGSSKYPFCSHIDGNNLTVDDLEISGKGYSDVGIFGYVDFYGSVHDLFFERPVINAANADATALSASAHAAHDTHVYVGYLAGHVNSPGSFVDVYLNNCSIKNDESSDYEMINSYGYYGHSDEPIQSTPDSSTYTTELNAQKAYASIAYTYENSTNKLLARRYTSEQASGNYKDYAVKKESNSYYRIDKKNDSSPYSLSSIGYASGDAGLSEYARYLDDGGRLQLINDVEPDNILSEVPEDWSEKFDGSYIYYDESDEDEPWKYTTVSSTGTGVIQDVELNCFTISYTQTIDNTTNKYYLKYQPKQGNTGYATLVPQIWNYDTIPQDDIFYFCFKSSFGSIGVSRINECGNEADYYIYSIAGDNYLSTYAPQNVHSNPPYCDDLVHTPVFVPEEGEGPTGHVHYPMKFTIGGPQTAITYSSVQNSTRGDQVDVNACFDTTTKRTLVKGALQGSNLSTFGAFGGHKMTGQCPGGLFTIGEYKENQTTSLVNAVNFRLTSDYADIEDNSTLIIAGYDGIQEDTYSIDYAMGIQAENNRLAKTVKEVRDKTGYVINETTSVAKLTVEYVNPNNKNEGFALYCDGGYICYDPSHSGNKNNVLTKPAFDDNGDPIVLDDSCIWYYRDYHYTDPQHPYTTYYTRYRFENKGTPGRYLCYNPDLWVKDGDPPKPAGSGVNRLFACYTMKLVTPADPEDPTSEDIYEFDERTANWFYIYKQQNGQTIQNVHFVTSVTKTVQGKVYPTKVVSDPKTIISAPITATQTDPSAYSPFTKDPTKSVYFDTTNSQVHYYDVQIQIWKRVSLVSEINSGDQVLISYNNQYFLSTTQNTNFRGRSSSVSFTPPYLANEKVPSNAQKLTVTKTDEGRLRFDTGSGFLSAYNVSNTDSLRTLPTPDANGGSDFAITIDLNGNATLTAQTNISRNKMKYGQYRSGWSYTYGFSCGSSATSLQIYKLTSSNASEATYVGDLIDGYEPLRMDAVGPDIRYYSDHIQVNSNNPTVPASIPPAESKFYPSVLFKNVFCLMIDANSSCDLGNLYITCTNSSSSLPYFITSDNIISQQEYNIKAFGAIDQGNGNSHSYLLNINANNISRIKYCDLEGDGLDSQPYRIWTDASENEQTKYAILLAFPNDINITSIKFNFNAVPGNIGDAGKVDYRSATYNESTGEFLDGHVEYSALSIYYDITEVSQKLRIDVRYTPENGNDPAEYYVTISTNSSETYLTEDVDITFFKYDNNQSILKVNIDGVVTTHYAGTLRLTIAANAP